MKNDGQMPASATVDIRFRNGLIARGVDPTKMRWEPHPDGKGPSSFDILDWQISAQADAA